MHVEVRVTKSKGILGPRAEWTDEQLEQLRALYPKFRTEDVAFLLGHPLQVVYRKANSLGLKKSEEFLASGAAGRLDGIRGGCTRFQKGITPWNKGVTGVNMGDSATRFKTGQAPHNTLPVGSLKLDKDDVLLRKISDAKGNNSARWRSVHELVWVEANGPMPSKHMVVFKPGMRTNVLEEITINRVECISLAENMRRNTRHNLPPELNQVVQLRAVLTRQINKRMKHGQEEHR
jgi:hypothetical protein